MISDLEQQHVITKCEFEPGDYMNTVFLKGEKKYGGGN